MKKIPWGIIAGISAVVIFFATAGMIVGYMILNGIAGATAESVGLFDLWWQTVLFIADLVFFVLFVVSVVLYAVCKKRRGKEK